MTQPGRRTLIRGGAGLSALSLLAGCDISDTDPVQRVLGAFSRWNDKVQAALFSRDRLAPTYPASMITRPFPFNAYYSEDRVRTVDESAWRLELSGLIEDKRPW